MCLTLSIARSHPMPTYTYIFHSSPLRGNGLHHKPLLEFRLAMERLVIPHSDSLFGIVKNDHVEAKPILYALCIQEYATRLHSCIQAYTYATIWLSKVLYSVNEQAKYAIKQSTKCFRPLFFPHCPLPPISTIPFLRCACNPSLSLRVRQAAMCWPVPGSEAFSCLRFISITFFTPPFPIHSTAATDRAAPLVCLLIKVCRLSRLLWDHAGCSLGTVITWQPFFKQGHAWH